MLEFIKKWFSRKEQIKVETVDIDELDSWLKLKLSQIDFNQEIAGFFSLIKESKFNLTEKLAALQQAEMDYKESENLNPKIKNIVIGHRDNYVRQMQIFVEHLNLPENSFDEEKSGEARPDGSAVNESKSGISIHLDGNSLVEAIFFSSELNQQLDQLAARTAKSYQAAQHLYFKPVEEVFTIVAEINLRAKSFQQQLEQRGMKKVQELQEMIGLLAELQDKGERLKREVKWKEQKKERCLQGKEKQLQNIERFKNSNDYQQFLGLKEKEKKINGNILENEDKVHTFFSRLSRALRKYEKVAVETDLKLVQAYSEQAIEAFAEDKELKIIEILKQLSSSIEKNAVILDEKQAQQVKELIVQAEEGYLLQLQNKFSSIGQEMDELKDRLRKSTIDKFIAEAEFKLDHFNEQIELVSKELEELKIKLNAFNEKELIERVTQTVKEMLKIDVKIIRTEINVQNSPEINQEDTLEIKSN